MLKVDLGTLARQHRIRIDAELPPDDAAWDPFPWRLDGPVLVQLDVQHAGEDVVARGHLRGRVILSCRRCLRPVEREVSEELTLVYKAGLSAVEAEAAEVYELPARGHELDLGPAVREHVILAVPQFALCRESCRGFCPRCGTDWNEAACECTEEETDPRWAALRRSRSE
jgi:uncharacterized protein